MATLGKHGSIYLRIVLYLSACLYVSQVHYYVHYDDSKNTAKIRMSVWNSTSELAKPKSTWLIIANKTDCASRAWHHKVNENSPPLPLTGLLSIHGSGNSWLRWLIERMTGICTGSVYQERQMVSLGFPCELGDIRLGTTIVQKSHYLHHLNSTKILLLIRNPFESLVSDFNRILTAGNHTGVAKVSAFHGKEWEDYVRLRIKDWEEQISLTLATVKDVYVIFYENLKRDLKFQLKRIAEFLRVFVSEARMECVLRNPTGKLKRFHPEKRNWDYFTSAQISLIRSAIWNVIIAVRSRGISDIPEDYLSLADATHQ